MAAAAHRERAKRYADFLARLDAIDRAKLTENARTNALVLRTLLEAEIGDARFAEWEMPFDSDSNFWSYLAPRGGFTSVEQYENYIGRMRDIPRYFAEHTANSRAGLARGFSVPRVTLEGRDVSIATYVVDDPERSPFWTPFADMPRHSRRRAGAAKPAASHEQQVTPAYAKWLTFREEYLPNTRTTSARASFPKAPPITRSRSATDTRPDCRTDPRDRTGGSRAHHCRDGKG